MKRDLLITLAILIILAVVIVGFFRLLPPQSITIGNFIGYMSSLSTIVMVLIYIFTTSRQLNVMRGQLSEMASTKILQTQPLPYIKPSDKCHIEAPKIWIGPPDWTIRIHCRLRFFATIENIGNGTAVAIDVIPKLIYEDKNGKIVIEQPVCERVESLKEGESKEIDCMFVEDFNHRVINTFLFDRPDELCTPERPYLPAIELTILYKNVLGGSFRAKIKFDIWFYDEDVEILRSCLKILEAAKIDYADSIREHDSLVLRMHEDSKIARDIRHQLNKEFSKKVGFKDIAFISDPAVASFSVSPISEQEYLYEFRSGYPHRVGISRKKRNRKKKV